MVVFTVLLEVVKMSKLLAFRRYAEQHGMHISNDEAHVNNVIEGMKRKKDKCGIAYCPCVPPSEHNIDTICPCKSCKEDNVCQCGLFVK